MRKCSKNATQQRRVNASAAEKQSPPAFIEKTQKSVIAEYEKTIIFLFPRARAACS